ncbi:hypothetical protein MNBD_NITROSPINAE05-290 [hydrothermal vent metagenome]|uniref:Uncharacterized protein n=1 Tax=hydrothermal vent metagenome TaxID=652676 RepID=A0A3B1D3F9_9ZZZZ
MIKTLLTWVSAILILIFLLQWTNQTELKNGYPAIVTGWFFIVVLVALSLFNIRKKLSSLPLANSSTWLGLHMPGGVLAMGIFWLHTGSLWPLGVYEKFLAFLFYATFMTGVLGLLIQKSFPRRLTRSGGEYIFERIPMEIVEIQKKAKEILLTCTEETKRDTLATQFFEHLDWYFHRPRFFLNHIFGGQKGEIWVRQQCSNMELALNPQERIYLQKIFTLANTKRSLDIHYALQTILKGWSMFHLPLALTLLTLALWHLLVVYTYFL